MSSLPDILYSHPGRRSFSAPKASPAPTKSRAHPTLGKRYDPNSSPTATETDALLSTSTSNGNVNGTSPSAEDERALIKKSGSIGDGESALVDEDIGDDDPDGINADFWQSFKILFSSAGPVTIGFLLEAGFALSSTVIAGRLGPIELAIVGQGIQIMGVTSSIMILSCTAAQTTLSAPIFSATQSITSSSATNSAITNAAETFPADSAFAGLDPANIPPPIARTEIGTLAQRSFVLAHLSVAPIVVLWIFIEPLLRHLDQPESVIQGLGNFMRYLILTIPGYTLMETSKAYLQAQSLFHPPTFVVTAVLPLHAFLTYVLVHHTALRENGVAVALAISYSVVGLLLVAYIAWREKRLEEGEGCWGGLTKRAFNGWGRFFGISLPCAMMFGSEWWNFEIVSLFAGKLGEASIAAQAAITSMDIFLAMIPYASGLATTVRLGQLLGHRHPGAARAAVITVRAGYAMAIGITFLLALALVTLRGIVAKAWIDGDGEVEVEVRDLIKRVLVPIATYQVWDGMAAIASAILRSVALHNFQAVIVTIAYYLFGLPLGYFLAFHRGWGLVGLWSGSSFGLFWVGMIGLGFYTLRIDWVKEAKKAKRRAMMERMEEDAIMDQEAEEAEPTPGYGAINHS